MEKKKIALFCYDGFAEYTISLALMYLKKNRDIITIALQKREYLSCENQRFLVDASLNDCDPTDIDVLIIPGGDTESLLPCSQLSDYITTVIAAKGSVAGIGNGANLIVEMGFLDGRRCAENDTIFPRFPHPKTAYANTCFVNEAVVIDGRFITAKAHAFVEFAETLKKTFGIREGLCDEYKTWMTPIVGWMKVTDSILVSQSTFEECNMTIIVSQNEAILIDTGYRQAEAQRVLDYIKEHHLMLKNIVITHHHEDHDANMALFSMNQGIVYDSTNCGDDKMIKVGKLTLRLFATPGHFSLGDISVLVIEENVLIAGDILYSCLPIQLCYGAKPVILRETVEKIAKAHYDWIIPGHGKIMTGDTITEMAISYIDKLNARIDDVVKKHGSEDDLYDIKLKDCVEHVDWMVEEPAIDLHRQNKLELFHAKLKSL